VLVSLTIVALVATTGCGSSRSKQVAHHSPNHHYYSVQQVEAAFAKHGIRLHRVVVPGTKLLGGSFPNASPAERKRLMRQVRRQIRLLDRSVVNLRGHDVDVRVMSGALRLADHVVVNGGAGEVALIQHGNLIGSFDTRDRAAVNSALAELH
jgi:uncharacterized protein YceK